MKTKRITAIYLIITLTFLSFYSAVAQRNSAPKGWIVSGNKYDSYEMGMDESVVYSGKYSAYIKSVRAKIKGFGTLMQTCKAEKYHDRRVRLSAYIKAQDVEDWAGLWMRVDDYDVYNVALGFDNMSNRPIIGTIDWKKYEVVLDVPQNSSKIVFGVLLSGTGQVWFDNIELEIVDKTVPTTDIEDILEFPMNLGFEE